MEDFKSIGRRIRQYREKMGIKQEDFAELVNLSPTYMGAIERGIKFPKLETFIRIANALKVPSDFLLSDVLLAGNEIRGSVLSEKLKTLPDDEQTRILNVLEVMMAGPAYRSIPIQEPSEETPGRPDKMKDGDYAS